MTTRDTQEQSETTMIFTRNIPLPIAIGGIGFMIAIAVPGGVNGGAGFIIGLIVGVFILLAVVAVNIHYEKKQSVIAQRQSAIDSVIGSMKEIASIMQRINDSMEATRETDESSERDSVRKEV